MLLYLKDDAIKAGVCYLKETLINLHLPRLVHDRGEMLNSILLLRKLQRAGAKIIYGHDPAFWATLPQAPECVV